MNNKSSIKVVLALFGIAILVFGIIYFGISFTSNLGKSKTEITTENAMDQLNKLYKNINISTIEARKDPETKIGIPDIKESLPNISKFPAQVENTTDSFVEIFSSTEKAGEKKDGWLNEVARDFNNSGFKVNGKPISVRIRGIASGMGLDYIVSGKYVPEAFTPSNELWGKMAEAQGTQIKLIDKRITGNVTGILLSKSNHETLVKKYGSINLKTITEAVSANEIAMGYTNPFASSTGLNFLVSTLLTFDNKDPLSDKAVSGFEKFQANIPFVSYTTLQMRDSAKSGVLDGFIMEYQTYNNTPELKNDYVFTPFGVRHDSPMYELGNLSAEKKEILKDFVEFCKLEKNQNLATQYGFNQRDEYQSETRELDGNTITSAQKIWKEKKNASKDISAVFVTDTSGSMSGDGIINLRQSLLNGSQYIGKDNSIGIVSFSDDVRINLPIAKFDINQRSLFSGAVKDLQASGSTAMFDGIIVATKMLMEEKIKNPNADLMLFVLSDGETNTGHSLNNVQGLLKALKIPIYTIGYNKPDISALQTLSSINEAASINADSEDVVYKLQSLFNAQM